jgi:hypothetical protein
MALNKIHAAKFACIAIPPEPSPKLRSELENRTQEIAVKGITSRLPEELDVAMRGPI